MASFYAQKMNKNIITCIRIKDPELLQAQGKDYIKHQGKTYHADAIFSGPDQELLFKSISKNILEKCAQGYNCSIFAYGQTGSGKTYTIQGDAAAPGLVLRSLHFLHDIYGSLRLSFIEVYNENMIDLFSPDNVLSIREDPSDGVTIDNLDIRVSTSLAESLAMYEHGVSNRRTATTQMNESSSRSHSVFTIMLEFRERNVTKKSKLCFVDLAGSEKYREAEAERVKETCNINKSLLCLGKIVHKLGSNDRWHVSYRDSKLTFLLKDSLGGNSRLAIIGTVSLAHPAETVNTLQFLERTKMISNRPSINYDAAGSSVEELVESLRVLEEENQALREEMAQQHENQSHSIRNGLIFAIKKLRREVEDARERFAELRTEFAGLIEKYFDRHSRAILEINENISNINNGRREGIMNMRIKRKHLDEQ